jgi:hypothetical protein
MDELKVALPPWDSLPPWLHDLAGEPLAWCAAGGALVVLLLLPRMVRGLWRLLFGRRQGPEVPSDAELYEDLCQCPLPVQPPGRRRLTVYHLLVRLRLVVVAPCGKDTDIDATAIERLLDHVVPGLGAIMARDKPRVRVWPPQLSHQGFTVAFHRRTRKPDADGLPSRWVLVAGRAQIGRLAVLLGLGLWADEPNALGRISLEPHQWLDVLRLTTVEE